MARINGYLAFDMYDLSVEDGDVLEYNGRRIVIGDGDYRAVYLGDFDYDSNGAVHGSLTGFEYYAGHRLAVSATNFDVDANFAFDALTSGDSDALVMAVTNGDDAIFGSSGPDGLAGYNGDDLIYGYAGDDDLYGDAGDDEISGGPNDDLIYGGPGRDYLLGDEGNDTINGNQDDDTIYGGPGRDVLSGGGADDIIYGEQGVDVLVGGFGNDTLYGDQAEDKLRGRWDDDVLYGGNGKDEILGNADDDKLFGQNAPDFLVGGLGADTISGGHGNDRFHYRTAAEVDGDELTDFDTGNDIIALRRFDANESEAGVQGFSFIGNDGFSGDGGELRAVVQGGDTIVTGDVTGDGDADFVLTVLGVTNLSESDFLI
ncbi:hypothetical protein DLJ53_07815 [Acuticoccus sediminis]|uniref:Hemolysin type calcium-binding protein n=1 Tax=Acuticoccus sediminis TaxID=2184697 RepID=A0A8B2P038_9HYPH|nr:calcium-binding protein [Acuticoccus sediminis]RAI04340.1 hypothetical protein DLJ53_07815 [Acuticoccus sediminis]